MEKKNSWKTVLEFEHHVVVKVNQDPHYELSRMQEKMEKVFPDSFELEELSPLGQVIQPQDIEAIKTRGIFLQTRPDHPGSFATICRFVYRFPVREGDEGRLMAEDVLFQLKLEPKDFARVQIIDNLEILS